MKPTHEELAEAALFLAEHLDYERKVPAPEMSAAATARIAAEGRRVVDARHRSTTQAGIVSFDADPVPRADKGVSRLRKWGPWVAIAAGVFFTVYTWRSASVVRNSDGGVAAAGSSVDVAVVATDGTGKPVAELRRSSQGALSVRVVDMAGLAKSEQVRVWISMSGKAEARAAGSFRCESPCSGLVLALPDTLGQGALGEGEVEGLWLTVARDIDPWRLDEGSRIVAEGHRRRP